MEEDSKLILVAEDDFFNYMYIEEILIPRGYKLLHARTGGEAIDFAKNNQDIAAILMDIKMPEINGYDAYEKIREFNPDVPIIAQTAYALSDDLKKIEAYGFTDVITKPIKIKDFIIKLNKHIK